MCMICMYMCMIWEEGRGSIIKMDTEKIRGEVDTEQMS